MGGIHPPSNGNPLIMGKNAEIYRLVGIVVACVGLMIAAWVGGWAAIVAGAVLMVGGGVLYIVNHDGFVF
ncbi:hypothetical protein GCM10009850_009950 [Nonomuraea monospora]|uniref:DUF2892 domain-containing protein n=1 Tax=Nonomuraea monospora TaxID=568818 RepID=A0ABN3C8Q3_9ACTN